MLFSYSENVDSLHHSTLLFMQILANVSFGAEIGSFI